ncbi:MAG: hypothetical protein IKK57_01360 [Clostridia bacterium]|nr:hypothetical protein [Clostridia bacterium]
MKRNWKTVMIVLALLAALAMLPVLSQAESRGSVSVRTPVYTGPGEQYVQVPGMTLREGDQVTVRTQYRSGGQTWLQVAFIRNGQEVRGYIPEEAANVSLRNVPVEAPLCAGELAEAAIPYAGPDGPVLEDDIRQGVSAVIYEVEDGWVHIEYYCSRKVMKARAWVPLSAMMADIPLGFTGYYGVAEETSLLVPTPTRAPSTYYGETQGYPVGKMCTVVAGACHIKEEAGEDWPTVAYGYVGERYKVLDCCTGSTGKDWYLVKKDGVYGWISSGLVSLDR